MNNYTHSLFVMTCFVLLIYKYSIIAYTSNYVFFDCIRRSDLFDDEMILPHVYLVTIYSCYTMYKLIQTLSHNSLIFN